MSTMKSNVLVVGSGSVGTITAYALEAGGQATVTSVLRSNFAVVEKSGFSIDSVDYGQEIRGWRPTHIRNTIPDVAKEALVSFDFVVVTTKNIPDVPPTVADLIETAVTTGHTAIVLMQNGLNIERPLVEKFPRNVVLSGVQMIGATETSPGVVVHAEPDDSKIGCFKNEHVSDHVGEALARKFVAVYSASGKAHCVYDSDVSYTRWRKLLYNSSYNAVAGVLQMDVTRMRVYEHIIDGLIRPVMKEIQAIALAAAQVTLEDQILECLITVDSPESWFMPSMGQDSQKGNLMEFENIIGEPMRVGQRVGLPCPILETLYRLLEGLQAKVKEKRGIVKPIFTPTSKYFA